MPDCLSVVLSVYLIVCVCLFACLSATGFVLCIYVDIVPIYLQVKGHAAAAQSAQLVFIAVHREHYDFLESLGEQLTGKVSPP